MEKELKGKLNSEQLADLDRLLLKLKNFNRCNFADFEGGVVKRRLKLEEIRPLKVEDNERLWRYLRHCCLLASMTESSQNSLKSLTYIDPHLEFDSLVNDAISYMTIHVYRYAWRKYEHSDDAGYVINSAFLGLKSFCDEYRERFKNEKVMIDAASDALPDISGNHKKSINKSHDF